MKAIQFEGQNAVLGEGQPGVNPLPCHRANDEQVTITTCWALTDAERAAVAATGKIWFQTWTFGSRLQPILPRVYNPLDDEHWRPEERAVVDAEIAEDRAAAEARRAEADGQADAASILQEQAENAERAEEDRAFEHGQGEEGGHAEEA